MKIIPKPRKVIAPPPAVTELINNLVSSNNEELVVLLKNIDAWRWPRSDLNAWIKVLNKFDDTFDSIIKEYSIDKLQITPFAPQTRELLSEILRFERLLLENSTNRKTFNSYDRLNSLLSTSDLDILILALNLLLRPSQQYSAQASVAHALSISTTRLQSLSKRWPHLAEYNIGLVDLVGEQSEDVMERVPQEAREVNFSFYKTQSTAEQEKKPEPVADAVPATPRKTVTPAPISNAVHIRIDEQKLSSQSAMETLKETIEAYSVPESETFELLCRIRSASSLVKEKKTEREKLTIIRLLAIAIYGHTHSETQAMSALFLYEPDLIPHIAELLQVDPRISTHIQTAAIGALDALARYKSKVQEVLSAVNAGVNHGVLMALMRNMVTHIADPESTLPHSFIEALLSFITYIASHASGGNMIVGAGLIPLLIQIMEIKASSRLPVISKTMQLVDNVLYTYQNAFSLFCASRGVDVLVERIEHEIEFDIQEYGVENQSCALSGQGELPIQRIAVLKHILRSMHRMMQSSGTAEGLRGLIDTTLLKSAKKIMEWRGVFGPNIFPIAINIMSTFVHNEPTSLAIIQEAGVPEIFYKAIETGIEPAIEVVQSIPNAIGALCLNEIGQAQLEKRPSIIPAIFSIFTSERHLKVLLDKENAVIIGTAVDELIRHHPSLKTAVFSSLKSTLSAIEDLGLSHVVPGDIKQWYRLIPVPSARDEDADVVMTETVPGTEAAHQEAAMETTVESGGVHPEEDSEDDETNVKDHENVVAGYIDSIGRFLEGFFQHPPHCKDFITMADGMKAIGRLTGLPCLPYDFANSVASDSMVQILRTMTEVSPNDTLVDMTKLVKQSLDDTRDFWQNVEEPSKLLPLVDLPADQTEAANEKFRSLVTLHIRITLLSDVFATAGQGQGRTVIGLLQTLINNVSPAVLDELGALHRCTLWENIALNSGLARKGVDVHTGSTPSPLEQSPRVLPAELPLEPAAGQPLSVANGPTGANGVPEASSTPFPATNSVKPRKQESPRDWNAAALKHITQGLPNALAPFFQAMIKMFHARRNPEPGQKKQVIQASKMLADIMIKHLTPLDFSEKPSLYNYYGFIFGLFFILLVDDRTTTHSLHTVELFAFYQAGGFEAMHKICQVLVEKINEVEQLKEEDRTELQTKELVHAYGALKVALHLLHPIISSKPLFESPQTVLITTRDKKETDPDYFEPHDFLVKLRLAILPLIKELWEAPWLIPVQIGVSRYVVRAVLEIVGADNEEAKGDGSGEFPSLPPQPSGPDQTHVLTLTSMGFPRSAVERALARTNNNISTATEILLSTPFPLPPDPVPGSAITESAPEPAEIAPEPVTQPVVEPTTEPVAEPAAEPSTGEASGTEEPDPSAPSEGEPQAAAEATIEEPSGKTPAEWRAELNKSRENLQASLSTQSLLLIDQHPDLVFHLHSAFTKSGLHQAAAVSKLISDVEAFSVAAYDVHEQPLANRCRLLALVLCETPSSMDDASRNALMNHLLVLLLSGIDPERPPRWLAAHLLVLEALFTLSDEPKSITIPSEGQPIEPQTVPIGPDRTEARKQVFDFCLKLLAVPDLPNDELLSVLRLLVLLTRDREMAAVFISCDGLSQLLKRIRSSAAPGSSSYIATILRHLVEDATTVQSIVQQTVKRYFSSGRSKVTDANTYVRNCSAIALRDVNIFLDVTKSLCQLTHPYTPSAQISLKPEVTEKDASKEKGNSNSDPSAEMQVDSPAISQTTASQKSVDVVVHLLVSELMTTYKQIVETPLATDETSPTPTVPSQAAPPALSSAATTVQDAAALPAAPSTDESKSSASTAQDKYQYLFFIMQCLTELLFSYDSCKIAFLSYSAKKRPQQTPSKENGKLRTTTLQFMLNDLLTYGTVNPSATTDSNTRQKSLLCNWAMNVLGALCVDTSSSHEMKDVSPELVNVRKLVLEAINRSIKDVSSTDNTELRYSKLLALADLCQRLLTVRTNATSRKQTDEVPTHLAKIMLEKNFVSILTTAMSEVDLNYPNIKNVVSAILRPLEYLSKIAIKMSKASGKVKDELKEETPSDSEEEEDEEMEDTDREETPDFYRNSALGMYSGEMDDGQYQEDEGMDDDEDEEDVEMDYDETGSEDTSATDDDDDEEEVMDERSVSSAEEWIEGEGGEDNLIEAQDEDEEDEDEDEPEEEEDDDVDEGEGDDDDEGWADVQEDERLGLSVIDDDGHGVPIPISFEDEPEPASDEEELNAMMDHPFNHDHHFPFADLAATFRDMSAPNIFLRRHRPPTDGQAFGRSRSVPSAPEATTHPLLLDITSSANRAQQSRSRYRQGHAIMPTPGFFPFEQYFSDGSIQMLQQLMSQDGFGSDGFRITVPAGTIFHHGRRFSSAPGRSDRLSRPHSQRQGREFDPQLTIQRWAEEAKILHGDFLVERVTKLANHVILALLPAAVKAAEEAKIKEAEAARIREEEEAARKVEEEAAKAEAEEKARREVEETAQREAEEAARKEREAAEQGLKEEVAAVAVEEPTTQEDTPMVDSTATPSDADMADATATASEPVEEPAPTESETSAGPSVTQNRITVMIHGSPVDITDTGIDPDFLEALPDDMREEVLNQHVRESQAARVERPSDSQISAEFLDALPPEIRAEIIQQEAIERSRRRTEELIPARAPEEIDPASFIASLDPTLRQAVLLEQDEGFIQSLPSHMIAEAGAYREEITARRNFASRSIVPPRHAQPASAPTRKYLPTHEAIHLLDRGGVAILVRLLFFPQVLKKTLLFKVLVNLCENSKTRVELFNILLSILQDGTGDLAAVDKSFSQLSVRGRETKPPVTPKAAGKQKAVAEPTPPPPASQIEVVPDLIAQRCLEALIYIVSTNEPSSLFFLTDHELPTSLKKAGSKKGKGKEKPTAQTYYPIVLLLNLLERQSLLRTPSILESVVSLLATVTRPLTTLKDKKTQEQAAADARSTSDAAAAPTPSSALDTNAPSEAQQPVAQPADAAGASSAPPVESTEQPKDAAPVVEEKVILAHPPQIPLPALRLIVNILTAGECSGKTFQQSLALIQHLSCIPDAREEIALELKVKAQEFGQALHVELDQLAVALQDPPNSIMLTTVAANFSSASSTQAKLLRVLKTIDYMYTPKSSTSTTTSPEATAAEDVEKVQKIYESFSFSPLWQRLGVCLGIIGAKPETEHIATVLLPLIEALMVVCKFVGSKTSSSLPRALRGSMSPRSPTSQESMEDLFVSFTDSHRKILNLMVRNNPSLMSGSFSLLVNNPRVLDFDNKRNYFNQQLHRKPHAREHHGTLQLNVRRARVFEDSFLYLQRKTGDQIKYGKLSIRFYDEEGVDAGGLTREWFQILARQMFNPDYALFQPCAADKLTYQPNKNSGINPEHLAFFKFVGRVIGKAIYDGRLLDAYFARSLYRQLLGKQVDYKDVEWVDPEYYNSLCWILENDPTLLDLTFSVEAHAFGLNRIVPLKEGGETIPVTLENRREFVQLSAQYRLYSSIKEQIESLCSGFYEIIPKDLITIFNEQELELLISGTPDIDVDEWRSTTEYNGYTSSDPNIVWWWRALKSFNREERAKVLSFATGTSRVPLSGFSDLQGVQGVQRFSIHRAYGEPDRLPQAHTCFNQIDLPPYTSYEMLRQQLLVAINEGGEGFAFS